MIEQSLTVCFLKRLFVALVNLVKSSIVLGSLPKMSDAISEKVKASGVYEWLGKGVFTDKYYDSSCVYAAAEKLWGFVLKCVGKMQSVTRKIFANSFLLAAFDFCNSRGIFSIDVFLAIFVGGMFAVPHEMWNNLYAFAAATVFAVWTVMNMASGKMKKGKIKAFGLGIGVFSVAVVISFATAYDVSDALRIALFLASAIMLAYCVYGALDTKEKLVRFLGIVLAFVTVTALFGIAQRMRGVEVDLEFVDVTANEGMPGRVYSTFSNPNNFAELLVLFLPFFIPMAVSVKSKMGKTVTLAAFFTVVCALAMTYSRSCWVGFALSAVVFVCLYDKRLLVPLALCAAAAVPFLPESIVNRIFTIGSMEDSSNSYRIYIWKSCLEMMHDYFLTGIGLGPASFATIYPGYASPVAITAPHSHMLYMEIMIEMGVLGAAGFLAYMYATIKRAAGSMRIMTKEMKLYAVAAISALGGIAFVCCAEYIWFYPRVMFAFWIIPGLLAAIVRIAKSSAAK